jgi:thiol-disulfide isomerase/thioredoxin
MKYRVVFLAFLSLFFIWQACDIIDEPIIQKPGGNGNGNGNGGNGNDTIPDTTIIVLKKVLIEEFTGHHCPNCPDGAAAVENIIAEYGEQIIAVSVHTNFFGRPTASFPADYRTEVGNELDLYFGMEAGLPAGMVNRTGFEGEHRLGPDELHGRVIEVLEADPVMDVNLSLNYESLNRTAEITVEVKLLEEMQRPMFLSVFVTEDSLVSPQKNNNEELGPTPEIPDYVHRHVLRDALNGAWGDVLCDGSLLLPPGTTYSTTFNYTLAAEWVENQCAFIAFVYDGETYDVLQAAEVKIKLSD